MGGGGKLIGRGSEKKVVELDGSFNATAKAVLFNNTMLLHSTVNSLESLLARGFAQMGFEECPAIQTGIRLHKLSLKSSPVVYVSLPQPVFNASCGFGLRGRYFPLRPNPRFSGIFSKPTSAWPTLYASLPQVLLAKLFSLASNFLRG